MKGKPFKKIASVLKAFAPTALTALGGPAGGLAATIMKRAMGDESMDDSTLEDAILQASQTPEGVAKLKQIEADLEKAEMENDFEFERLATENTRGAREMAIATTLKPQIIIACFYLAGYFTTLGYMLYLATQGYAFDDDMGDLIKVLLSAFGVGVPIILQFFFGSSAGSKAKDAAALGK